MLKYWLWLTTRTGLGVRGANLVAELFPSPEAIYFADEATYQAMGIRNYQPLLDKDLFIPEEILRRCYDRGISLLTMQDAAYPQQLRAIEDPPLVLYYRGQLPDFTNLTIAMVGTRSASAYGLTQAMRLGFGLGKCGVTVVSGCAKGIDTASMEGALTGGGKIIGVMGCGVDVAYPASNRNLYRDVVYHGCLLSEYPPGTKPKPEFFPVRNRILSGLSHGVVVVEAPEKSGALITAQRALDQGRDVFTLPGNVGVKSFGGNLALLREGAVLVRDTQDILQEYLAIFPDILRKSEAFEKEQQEQPHEVMVAQPAPSMPQTKNPEPKPILPKMPGGLSEDEEIIVKLLMKQTLDPDAIVDETQLPTGRVLAALTLLEVKGIVRRLPARRFALSQAEQT